MVFSEELSRYAINFERAGGAWKEALEGALIDLR